MCLIWIISWLESTKHFPSGLLAKIATINLRKDFNFEQKVYCSLDLTANGDRVTAGFAYVGQACKSRRTSVVEFQIPSTLAHELGHKYVTVAPQLIDSIFNNQMNMI